LPQALAGVEVAYYLLHSMERSSPAPFAERERIAAERFGAAAVAAGIRRIVYLGALQPRPARGAASRESAARSPAAGRQISRHLASRKAVERILLDAVPDSVALRASIVIGARSRSFRLLVHLLEHLPVLALPAWRRFRTQPIDARDVIELLVASAGARLPARRLDVAGPDVLSYGELISRIAELMLVNRPSLELGVNLTPVAASIAAAITGEDPEFVTALMESLDGDLLPADDRASELLQVPLHTIDAALEHALGEWEEFEPLAAR
jgi:nucleoside-diphosphate-sugar epimerase